MIYSIDTLIDSDLKNRLAKNLLVFLQSNGAAITSIAL